MMFWDYKPPTVIRRTIKVRVKKDFRPNPLADILPLGYECELYTNVTAEDECIAPQYCRVKDKGSNKIKIEKYAEGYVKPAGRLISITFVGANGGTYDTDIMYRCYGSSATLEETFDKLEIITHEKIQ